jgi:hypothetical protein
MSSPPQEGKSEEEQRPPTAWPVASGGDGPISTPVANEEVQKQTDSVTQDFAYSKTGSLTTPTTSAASSVADAAASGEDIATVELTKAVRKRHGQESSGTATAHKLNYTRHYNPAWTVPQASSLPTYPSASPAFPLPINALPVPDRTLTTRHDSGESHFSNYSTASGGPRLHSMSRPGLDTILSVVEMDTTISSTGNEHIRMESTTSSNFSQYSTMPSTPEPAGPKKLDWKRFLKK